MMASSMDVLLSKMVGEISDLQTEMRAVKLNAVVAPLNAGTTVVSTINAGIITATRPHISLIPETGTTDNLDFIGNPHDGKMIMLSVADGGDAVTVRHHTETVGGNISLRDEVGYLLDNQADSLLFLYKESTAKWEQIATASSGTGIDEFTELIDVPASYATFAGYAVAVNGAEDGLEFVPFSGGVDEFTELTDVPASYTGSAGDVVAVSITEDALEFVTLAPVAFTGAYGSLTGIPSTFSPSAHASSHQHGGGDEVATATPGNNAIVKANGAGKIDNGWLDIELAALAGLTSAVDALPYFTGSGTAALTTLTSFMRTHLDDVDAPAARSTLGLVIGTNVQAQDAELAAIAGLTSAADKVPYFTGLGTAALADLSSVARTLVAQTTQALMRTTGLGLGTIATQAEALYALLGGRSGGQTLNGDTASGGNLTLKSTAHATPGKILFGNSAYDEVNNRLGIGTITPSALIAVEGNANSSIGLFFQNINAGSSARSRVWCDSVGGDAYFVVSLNSVTFWSMGAKATTNDWVLSQGTIPGTNDKLRVTTAGLVAIGAFVPAARLDVLEPTIGEPVLRLASTATNDDVIDDWYHGRVATTNATVTTVATIAIPANTSVLIDVTCVARRTGGAAGGATDSGCGTTTAGLYNNAGTATVYTSFTSSFTYSGAGGPTVTIVGSGANALIRVTGVTNVNISWHLYYRVRQVNS